MSDIFISYSRKDSEQALQLAERLQGEGMSVWIDQRGIEAAASWSKEIVHAIDECQSFIVLISSNSLASENVSREVSIASDSKKKMLPIAIEDVKLTDELRYHLAGIQRVAFSQHDAIAQALRSFGITAAKAKTEDVRKTLMILPFEDLSPTQDNGWFADGLVSEMIDKLNKIKSLKLVDRQTSLQIKKKGHTIAELAQILEVRYFIEGSIRKFGEQIKISSALLDFETGDYLWQDTHKGVFADIFEIQETIADKVVQGLHLYLGSEEELGIRKKPTENEEAYEFYLKGAEEYRKYTRSGFERAIQLYEEARRLDATFSEALTSIAHVYSEYYRIFDPDPSHLQGAEVAIENVRMLEGESRSWCWIMSVFCRAKGDYAQAEYFARLALDLDTQGAAGYSALGVALKGQGKLAEASEAFRKSVIRSPVVVNYFQLFIVLSELNDTTALASTALEALPVYEKHLKLNPDDHFSRVSFASLLFYAGKNDEAKLWALDLLKNASTVDALALYNLACLFIKLGDKDSALNALLLSIDCGYSNLNILRRDPDLHPLRDSQAFEDILLGLEAKLTTQSSATLEGTEK